MNLYDHHFRTLPATIRADAAQKAGFARGALIQHRGNGFGPEDDDAIVRQFDLSGMREFWDVVLSEPMECDDFAHALAVHFMVIEHKPNGTDEDRLASGPAAIRVVDVVKVQLRSALRRARVDREPWFIEMPEPPPSTKLDAKAWLGFVPSDTYIEPLPPPPDGVDLSRLKVRPRPAAEWLLAMPMRRHLVPPSLTAYLVPPAKVQSESPGRPDIQETLPETPEPPAAVRPKRGPGRPSASHLMREQWAARKARGETLSVGADEAKALLAWLSHNHPSEKAPTIGVVQNHLSNQFATLKGQVNRS